MKWGLKGGISIDADSGPPRYVLWCCGGICHQLLTFFQIGCGHTVIHCAETACYLLADSWWHFILISLAFCCAGKILDIKHVVEIFFLPKINSVFQVWCGSINFIHSLQRKCQGCGLSWADFNPQTRKVVILFRIAFLF